MLDELMAVAKLDIIYAQSARRAVLAEARRGSHDRGIIGERYLNVALRSSGRFDERQGGTPIPIRGSALYALLSVG